MKHKQLQTLKPALIKKTAKVRAAALAATNHAALVTKMPINVLLPDLKIEHRSIESLKSAKRRTRKAMLAQRDAVMKSIQQFGFVDPILVNDDRVVDGHTRLDAMRALGETTIAVIDVKNLSEDQCRVLALSINRIAETGEWDLDKLRIEMIELEMLDFDLSVTNFSQPEIDIIKMDPEFEDDSALDALPDPLPGAAVSRPGDLWQMDSHRLLCANALEDTSYQILLGGDQVSAVFTDPPFNCAIKGNVSGLGKVNHGEFIMASGEMSDDEFLTFLKSFLLHSRAHCVHGAVVYVRMDWRQYPRLVIAADAAGLKNINMAVWDKGSGGMGALYRSAHELIGVFCNGITPATNNVKLGKHGRDRTNIWSYPGANKQGSSAAKLLGDHPTPKPVQLIANALLDVTKSGDLVLDPFAGSGTTIIACAETGRVARAIELDPKFVDVAVRSWNELSGEESRLSTTGETFAEVAARRSAEN